MLGSLVLRTNAYAKIKKGNGLFGFTVFRFLCQDFLIPVLLGFFLGHTMIWECRVGGCLSWQRELEKDRKWLIIPSKACASDTTSCLVSTPKLVLPFHTRVFGRLTRLKSNYAGNFSYEGVREQQGLIMREKGC